LQCPWLVEGWSLSGLLIARPGLGAPPVERLPR
jgi:hypothetical protein